MVIFRTFRLPLQGLMALALMIWAGASHAQYDDKAAPPIQLAGPTSAQGPKPVTAWPTRISMPWRLIGIDSVDAVAARAALTTSAAALAQAFAPGGASMSTPALPINLARRVASVIASPTLTTDATTVPLVVEPTWCTVMDRNVVMVTVADARTNELLGSAHTSMPRDARSTRGAAPGFVAALPRLMQAALAQANAKAGTAPADTMHLGLTLGRHVDRRDEGSSHCLNLLLEERLSREFTITRTLGVDMLSSVRRALNLPPELQRPSRLAMLNWQNLPERTATRKLPVTLTLATRYAEGVFGKTISKNPISTTSQWVIANGPTGAAGPTITITPDAGMLKTLADERQTLLKADWPRVAKVDRGWVYLDRGRAWGLRMRDRLIASNDDGKADEKVVKGHVVRFFGPEEKLVSPRGFPINEGAIVYIRKGQKETKVGMEFRMDPRSFPTPYPIK